MYIGKLRALYLASSIIKVIKFKRVGGVRRAARMGEMTYGYKLLGGNPGRK
jgi:hypothetical protein